MKFSTCYLVRVLATGFIVLTLLSIPLFWIRFFCRVNLSELTPDDARIVSIDPSGYISPDIEEDPNITQHSQVSANMDQAYFMSLGVFDYLISRCPMGRRSDVFVARSDENWAYFDRSSGRIICRYTQTEAMPDRSDLRRQVQYHIGPDGISEIPDEALGRFVEPIIDFNWQNWGSKQPNPPELIMYDRKLGRFFKVDFDRATVAKGPQIGDANLHQPIQIGWPEKTPFMLHLNWQAPRVDTSGDCDANLHQPIQIGWPEKTPFMLHLNWQAPRVDTSGDSRYYGSSYGRRSGDVIQSAQYYPASPHLLVLDKSGRIDLLDKKTLEFAGTAGRLPVPRTLFGSNRMATPDNTLSYAVRPLYLGERLWPPDSEDNNDPVPDPNSLRYAGMFAASLSRDGTSVAVNAFDDKGGLSKYSGSGSARYSGRRRTSRNSSDEVYFGTAWAPMFTFGKYLTETLHPPILSVASCFTASSFEAGAGHRALFLLPNSFFAMNARASRQRISVRIMATLLLILPSIILAAWLAAQVTKNATAIGIPKNARCFWTLLTLAFGLAGYITYRLTRPAITLVTCPNCGKGRRPDTDTCHHCTAKWEIPELIPPTWRVLDSQRTTCESIIHPNQETNS